MGIRAGIPVAITEAQTLSCVFAVTFCLTHQGDPPGWDAEPVSRDSEDSERRVALPFLQQFLGSGKGTYLSLLQV